jgi:hypothetical protein
MISSSVLAQKNPFTSRAAVVLSHKDVAQPLRVRKKLPDEVESLFRRENLTKRNETWLKSAIRRWHIVRGNRSLRQKKSPRFTELNACLISF